jgi:hypothetical protein
MREAVVLGALLGAALQSGCGGSSPLYSLGPTFKCLDDAGIPVTHHLDDTDYFVFDPIARAAGGGALHASIGLGSVVVAFERSEGDAKRTEEEYRASQPSIPAAANPPSDLDDVLKRRRNAVVIWQREGTDKAAERIEECLMSSAS